MKQTVEAIPPGMQTFLNKIAKTEGSITVTQGVLSFPDGTTTDLRLLSAGGLTSCYHCGALMNEAQRYICGCPKCIDQSQGVQHVQG